LRFALPLPVLFHLAPRPPTSTLFPYTTLFRSAEQATDGVVVRHFAFEIGFHRSVVHFDGRFDHGLTVLLGLLLEVSRDLDDVPLDRKSTRLNSSHVKISYAVFCLKKKNTVKCG